MRNIEARIKAVEKAVAQAEKIINSQPVLVDYTEEDLPINFYYEYDILGRLIRAEYVEWKDLISLYREVIIHKNPNIPFTDEQAARLLELEAKMRIPMEETRRRAFEFYQVAKAGGWFTDMSDGAVTSYFSHLLFKKHLDCQNWLTEQELKFTSWAWHNWDTIERE